MVSPEKKLGSPPPNASVISRLGFDDDVADSHARQIRTKDDSLRFVKGESPFDVTGIVVYEQGLPIIGVQDCLHAG